MIKSVQHFSFPENDTSIIEIIQQNVRSGCGMFRNWEEEEEVEIADNSPMNAILLWSILLSLLKLLHEGYTNLQLVAEG